MASNFFQVKKGVNLQPLATAVSAKGDLAYNSSTDKLELYNGAADPLVNEAKAATLTNKTLSGNTATNLISGSGTLTLNTTGTVTLPNATDTLVGKATTDVLTNKTLSGNTAVTLISGSGTLTLNTSGTATVPNATDTLVGKATTDTFTNKTFDAAGTGNSITNIANANIKSAAAIAVNKLAALTVSSVALTDSNGFLTTGTPSIAQGGTGQTSKAAAYDALSPNTTKGDVEVFNGTNNVRLGVGSDGQTIVADASQTAGLKWATLPQGNKNYITYNNFENNATTGWSLSHTTLASSIPNQASGSWSSASGSLAISTVSSGQLAGTYSLQQAWTGTTSVPGDMLVSQAYTIDIEDQAKIMAFKFYYSATVGASLLNFSGTSSDTYQIYIYDVANSAWIQPAGVYSMVQSSGVGIAQGTFQTPSNMTQFRIAIVCINASATGSHTLLFDDFYVGPQALAFGAAVSDFQSYTATVSAGLGTATNVSFFYKRVGDDAHITGSWTNGTVAASLASFSLPSGLSVDSSKLSLNNTTSNPGNFAGEWTHQGSAAELGRLVTAPSTDGTKIYLADQYQHANNLTPANGSSIMSSSGTVAVYAIVPIVGWSSNSVLSADTDTRVVSCQVTGATSSINSSPQIVKHATVVHDTHGGYSLSTGNYTVPVSGYYRVSGSAYITYASTTAGLAANLLIYKNGSQVYRALYEVPNTAALDIVIPVVGTVYANAGDTLAIFAYAGFTTPALQNDSGMTYACFERLSGPAVVAATESVNMRYSNTAGTTITKSADNKVPFATKDYDSHGGWATDTYTVPVSGKYSVKANLTIATGATWASGDFIEMDVNKNGAKHTSGNVVLFFGTFAGAITGQIEATVNCVAGDLITINLAPQKAAASNLTLNTTAGYNTVCIERVGN